MSPRIIPLHNDKSKFKFSEAFHISDTSQKKSEMIHFIYQSGFGDKVYRLLADWRIPVITTIEDRRHGALLMQKRTAPPGRKE